MRSLFILTIVFLLLNIERLSACSCIGQQTVEEAVKSSDAILVGTILSKQLTLLTDSTFLKMFPTDTVMRDSRMNKVTIACYELLVQVLYKEKVSTDTVKIFTGRGGGDCGFEFEVGSRYIIYGEKKTYFGRVFNNFKFPESNNIFWTNICTRTIEFSRDEINEIEKFTKKK
jgi:hypothetical protein